MGEGEGEDEGNVIGGDGRVTVERGEESKEEREGEESETGGEGVNGRLD